MSKAKADCIKAHIAKAQYYLELADKHQQLALAGEADAQSYDLHNGIESMMEDLDDLAYEVCVPLEMNTIDIGSGMYDAREGNEDSFSNLGL
jgi:hypothetical protein